MPTGTSTLLLLVPDFLFTQHCCREQTDGVPITTTVCPGTPVLVYDCYWTSFSCRLLLTLLLGKLVLMPHCCWTNFYPPQPDTLLCQSDLARLSRSHANPVRNQGAICKGSLPCRSSIFPSQRSADGNGATVPVGLISSIRLSGCHCWRVVEACFTFSKVYLSITIFLNVAHPLGRQTKVVNNILPTSS